MEGQSMTTNRLIFIKTGADVEKLAKELFNDRKAYFEIRGSRKTVNRVNVSFDKHTHLRQYILLSGGHFNPLGHYFPNVRSLNELQQRLSEILLLYIAGYRGQCFMTSKRL